jgi:hypothetical protein
MQVEWQVSTAERNGRYRRLAAFLMAAAPEDGVNRPLYLGSIEERFLVVNIPMTREFHQGLFWKNVSRSLDRLNLQPSAREHIEAQISARVPKPSNDWPLWGVTCIPRYNSKP